MKFVHALNAVIASALLAGGGTAFAQASSYTPGTVWTFTNIKIEPGQFEKYMDYLATTWKKANEFGVKEGNLVSYHVFSVNNPRSGDPDLILAVEGRDYFTVAQLLEQQKKFEAFTAADAHKTDTQFGERQSMRKLEGSMELQELKLK